MTESQIIELLSKGQKVPGLGIGDDVALLDGYAHDDKKLAVASDIIVENTHFRLSWSSAEDLAIKLVETNVSDFYVKGVKPSFAIMQLAISDTFQPDLPVFLKAVRDQLQKHQIQLIGGDTVSAGLNSFGLTLFGSCSGIIRRQAADKVPDGAILACAGTIGASSYALKKLLAGEQINRETLNGYLRPQSGRFELQLLQKALCSMDQSDSLFETLETIAKLNSISIQLFIDKIPVIAEYREPRTIEDVNHLLESAEDLAHLAVFPAELSPGLTKAGLEIIGVAKTTSPGTISVVWPSGKSEQVKSPAVYSHFD